METEQRELKLELSGMLLPSSKLVFIALKDAVQVLGLVGKNDQ